MRYLITLYLVGFAFILAACSEKQVTIREEAQDNTALVIADRRVMTYNIHLANPPPSGSKRDLPAIADDINQVEADLVALQEVDKYIGRSGLNVQQAKKLGKLTNMHPFYISNVCQ